LCKGINNFVPPKSSILPPPPPSLSSFCFYFEPSRGYLNLVEERNIHMKGIRRLVKGKLADACHEMVKK
jgi:hypothetical protein